MFEINFTLSIKITKFELDVNATKKHKPCQIKYEYIQNYHIYVYIMYDCSSKVVVHLTCFWLLSDHCVDVDFPFSFCFSFGTQLNSATPVGKEKR